MNTATRHDMDIMQAIYEIVGKYRTEVIRGLEWNTSPDVQLSTSYEVYGQLMLEMESMRRYSANPSDEPYTKGVQFRLGAGLVNVTPNPTLNGNQVAFPNGSVVDLNYKFVSNPERLVVFDCALPMGKQKKMIVKVQISMWQTGADKRPKALIYDKSRKHQGEFPADDDLLKKMGGRHKAFFEAEHLKDGKVMLFEETPWQDW